MATITSITTAEQLLEAPGLGRCELLRGELVAMPPSGAEHGYTVINISAPLAVFVKQKGLGAVFGAETGFQIGHAPDTVRAPDAAFLCARRIAGRPGKGFFQGPPDLAVEVVSPTDRRGEVLTKVQDWLEVGCRLVWVVDPQTRSVSVYRPGQGAKVLGTADQLSGEDVVPGFTLPVAEVFS